VVKESDSVGLEDEYGWETVQEQQRNFPYLTKMIDQRDIGRYE